jgi:hypothetical protein
MMEDSFVFDDGSGAFTGTYNNRKTSTAGGGKGMSDADNHDASTLHHLSLQPRASWTFADGKSQSGQVFMDEAKKLILFYADSAITVKDLANNTQETYQYASFVI